MISPLSTILSTSAICSVFLYTISEGLLLILSVSERESQKKYMHRPIASTGIWIKFGKIDSQG